MDPETGVGETSDKRSETQKLCPEGRWEGGRLSTRITTPTTSSQTQSPATGLWSSITGGVVPFDYPTRPPGVDLRPLAVSEPEINVDDIPVPSYPTAYSTNRTTEVGSSTDRIDSKTSRPIEQGRGSTHWDPSGWGDDIPDLSPGPTRLPVSSSRQIL